MKGRNRILVGGLAALLIVTIVPSSFASECSAVETARCAWERVLRRFDELREHLSVHQSRSEPRSETSVKEAVPVTPLRIGVVAEPGGVAVPPPKDGELNPPG